MKHTIAGLFLTVLAVALTGQPAAVADAAPSTVYAVDTYSRAIQNHWGTADQGGAYSLAGAGQDFDVNGSEATIRLSRGQARSVYLSAVSLVDVSMRVRVKTDKVSRGAPQFLFLIARRNASGANYLGRMRFAPDGTVHLRAAVQNGSTTTYLGTEAHLTSVKHTAGRFIYLRLKAVGTNPTTIQMHAWYAGTTEPGDWQYTTTDNTGVLQQAGTVGLRAKTRAKATNLPFVFSFDDLNVTNAAPDSNPEGSVYWGALVDGAAPSPGNLEPGGLFDRFEQRAGKKMSILHWGQPWKMGTSYLKFQTSYYSEVRQRGYIPFIDWGSFKLGDGINQPNFQLADIYNGAHDDYIKQWANDAKAWGHPFFLRFDWEMNGDWQFPWSEKLNGNQPGDYIKMWRHVHNIFKQQGVKNVTWVWCPNIASSSTTPMSSVYPGDAYVDWICLDGYNKYSTWLEFNQVFGAVGIDWLHNSYKEITSLAPNKPLILGETASLEAGDGGAKKAAWIQNAFLNDLPNRFPKIKGILWFNWDDRNAKYTFPIESSSASQKAFAEAIGSSYYAANDFADLNTSPIPPLQ